MPEEKLRKKYAGLAPMFSGKMPEKEHEFNKSKN